MNENIVKFPHRCTIEEEAAAWLIRLDGEKQPSPEDLVALREWLVRSPVHRETLEGLAGLWDRMNLLTELQVPLVKGDRRVDADPPEPLLLLTRGRAAAVLVFVLSLAIGFGILVWPDPFVSSNGLYATAVGRQESATLADGSVVLLNTNSQIRVEYGDHFRDIYLLQGEVHFSVAKNTDRPFRVYAGNGRVQAIGTAFTVYLTSTEVDVIVTDGQVALTKIKSFDNRPFSKETTFSAIERYGASLLDERDLQALGMIEAGERATIAVNAMDGTKLLPVVDIEIVEAQDMSKRLSWQEGVLTFTGDPLEVAIREISRYTTMSIDFSDPAIGAIKIGGRFPVGETDAMFAALEANFGLMVTRVSRDHVVLSVATE